MGYSVIIGGVDQHPLASTRGWADAKAWIDTIDAVEFRNLVHLAEYAWSQRLAELRGQIVAALKASPPHDSSVTETMRALVETLKDASDDDSIFVSDGTMEDDGEPDDGWESFTAKPSTVRSLASLNSGGSGSFEDLLASPPHVPDFDALGVEATKSATEILARVRRKLLNHAHGVVDLEDDLEELDLLVAQSHLASQIAGAVSVFAGFEPPNPIIYELKSPAIDWWKEETTTRFPWMTEASRWLKERGVITGGDVAAMVAEAEDASRLRWDSIKSVADLRSQLSDSLIAGDTLAQFKTRIDKATTSARSHLETGFLTATHQAYIHGKTSTLEKPIIAKLFPAVEYFATRDTRTRDWHRVLDHVAVEVGSPAYVVVRRALADFRCRCTIVSVQKKDLSKHRVIRDASDLPAEVLAHYPDAD